VSAGNPLRRLRRVLTPRIRTKLAEYTRTAGGRGEDHVINRNTYFATYEGRKSNIYLLQIQPINEENINHIIIIRTTIITVMNFEELGL
jgi:hypothetical protein